jgi:surface antigen
MRIVALVTSFVLTGAVIWVSQEVAHADTKINRLQTSINSSEENSENSYSDYFIVSSSTKYIDAILEDDDEVDTDALDEEELEPDPIVYTVESGDSLTSIARDHESEWLRIWYKNTEIEDPDLITIDQELVIPFADEELEERDLPEPEQVEALDAAEQSQQQQSTNSSSTSERTASSQPQVQSQPRGNTSGNLYAPGYCTWYAKNKRPDLPNNLGNANTWVSRASSQGFSTGSTPRVGAVAYQPASSLGHVAYVEAVHNDGTVTVSEMNWSGLYVVTERRVAASTFTYIY